MFAALHEYLDGYIARYQFVRYETANKCEFRIRGGWKTNFDFLEADFDQGLEHFDLLFDAHWNRERLVAIS